MIGGGVGAMTAVFELTEQPGWQQRYEITVYQLGWRLGGKGASGRNQARNDRIEEHGLHFWFGYYENAFNLIQRVYAALDRHAGAPLATWRDAFKPHSLFILMQFYEAKWSEWHLSPPQMPGVPGDGEVPPFWHAVDRLLELLHIHVQTTMPGDMHDALHEHHGLKAWAIWALEKLGVELVRGVEAIDFRAAREAVQRVAANPQDDGAHALLHDAVAALEHFVARIAETVHARFAAMIERDVEAIPILRRALSLLELGFYMFKGIVVDDVARKGFDQLDGMDLREWLSSHGAGSAALDSDALRVAYESIFAFSRGSYQLPDLAAGTGLRGLLRLSGTYKEAFAYKMQAGMGDTIFGPFYDVLAARGVDFQFFSALREIVPSADGTRIEQLVIGRQALVKKGEAYDPLYEVKGLRCWPSAPFFDKLEQGDEIAKLKPGLESHWCQWPDRRTDRLLCGEHFDTVILGTSIGPIPTFGKALMDQKPPIRAMVDQVEAIGTQAFQMWTRPDDAALRRAHNGEEVEKTGVQPIYGGFAQPHNTVADMSHLLERENWPSDDPPGAIYYFCGPLALKPELPPRSDTSYPQDQGSAAGVRAAEWMRSNLQFLLPGSMFPGYPASFPVTLDFSMLYSRNWQQIPASGNFDDQFWRANVDPSELYVLSCRKTTQYRLHSGDTGYINLVFAGDWTRTGLNYGCVEAAVMSGMEASRAICGAPKIIFGENYPLP
ncbi:NAD(P)-binding protein [Novosphingobium kunmingense]|uniref:NAD(P)-binding protein n=1 Tax=Novosphingobium kunmingense TaxID=1211806 RepID=UPI0022B7F5A2|nr:NAD(P)-binding protein [Novosphingobium kunmingense]